MKTLIIGGSGFLGSALAESKDLGEIHSTFFTNPAKSHIFLDLSKRESIIDVLEKTKPDVVIHCGGLTDTDYCEKNKELALKVNVNGTKDLVNSFTGKLIYFSTDYVFDGKNPPYDENAEPNPLNHYGKTKLMAEKVVLARGENLVVRVAGLYGINTENNKFLNRLMGKQIINAHSNLFSTPTYIDDIITNLPYLLKTTGILHLTGKESVSRYNFVKKAADYLGFETEVIPTVYCPSLTLARRPQNTSLRSTTELKTTALDDAFREIKEKLK
jgi:dTDP-4-dehydrorhamnose reductase